MESVAYSRLIPNSASRPRPMAEYSAEMRLDVRLKNSRSAGTNALHPRKWMMLCNTPSKGVPLLFLSLVRQPWL